MMESRFKNFFNYGNPSEASQVLPALGFPSQLMSVKAPKGQSDSHPRLGSEFDRV